MGPFPGCLTLALGVLRYRDSALKVEGGMRRVTQRIGAGPTSTSVCEYRRAVLREGPIVTR
jgi:hypothetical protein